MSSMSRLNEQLALIHKAIMKELNCPREISRFKDVELLCRAQKHVIESQIGVFVELVESEIDMPTLPSFIEKRDGGPGVVLSMNDPEEDDT